MAREGRSIITIFAYRSGMDTWCLLGFSRSAMPDSSWMHVSAIPTDNFEEIAKGGKENWRWDAMRSHRLWRG
jgi:hypothetical protein